MRLSYLRSFSLVAELGSVSKAAEQLWMSQPAVSMEIKRLETLLGVALFDRAGNRLVLNDNGRACLRFAHRVDELFEDLKRDLSHPPIEPAVVTIGAHPVSARVILPPVLEEFHNRAGGTRLLVQDMPSGEIADRVFRHELDFGLVVRRGLRSDLAAEPVLSEQLWIVARSDHPLAHRPEVSPAEAGDFPFILLEPNTESHSLIQQWAIAHGVTLHVSMEVSSEDFLLEVVRRGMGLALVGESTVAEDVTSGRLTMLQVPGMPLYRTMYAIFVSSAWLSREARILLEAMMDQYARSAHLGNQTTDAEWAIPTIDRNDRSEGTDTNPTFLRREPRHKLAVATPSSTAAGGNSDVSSPG